MKARAILLIVLTACGTPAPEESPAKPASTSIPTMTPEVEPDEPDPIRECSGQPACDGPLIKTCVENADGSSHWSEPVACPAGEACRQKKCQLPSDKMRAQADAIDTFIDAFSAITGWHTSVDKAAAKAKARDAVLSGDGTDNAFFAAAWGAMNAYPQGHSGLSFAGCGGVVPWQQVSRFGVCGRASKDGIVVTAANKTNKLGLALGDTIIKAGSDSGETIATTSYARAQCGAVYPTASGQRDVGAASFFGTVISGQKLTVRALDGKTRELTVPTTAGTTLTCSDPFARPTEFYAKATVRADGVAVIQVPSFVPFDKAMPTDPNAFDAFIDAFEQEIVKVFETVKDAPAILWDVRGNSGGFTRVGLHIIDGFASAKATHISYCRNREDGSSPPAFWPDQYAAYDITPGGPFKYAGKVAILADGLSYSAADYFPYAAHRAANVLIVGSQTAGAFGGGAGSLTIAGPPNLTASVDAVACFDAVTDLPLEGASLPPSLAVDYDPADVAVGKDSVVEAAVIALGM